MISGKSTEQFGIFGGVYIGKLRPQSPKRGTFYGKLRAFIQKEPNEVVTLTAKANELESAQIILTPESEI